LGLGKGVSVVDRGYDVNRVVVAKLVFLMGYLRSATSFSLTVILSRNLVNDSYFFLGSGRENLDVIVVEEAFIISILNFESVGVQHLVLDLLSVRHLLTPLCTSNIDLVGVVELVNEIVLDSLVDWVIHVLIDKIRVSLAVVAFVHYFLSMHPCEDSGSVDHLVAFYLFFDG